MSLKTLSSQMLPAIESELQKQVARLDQPRTAVYHEMLTYHMGWTGQGAGSEATGKRIRPLMVLLCAAAAGSLDGLDPHNWQSALPAAASVELVHNFSLVHDDIQDNSEKRRGRPTLWTQWGIPQSINAGDGLFVLSNLAVTDLTRAYPAETALSTARVLHETCLDLTRGQFMDISYEKRLDLSEDDYWPMISGKTAALLAGCCQMGAILGGADSATEQAYRDFGLSLGLAFQVQDDILGIWGDEAVTGKSAASDLLEGKKSLPVLYGLGKNAGFAQRWQAGPITSADVAAVAKMLADEGASDYAQDKSKEWTDKALASLEKAKPQGEAGAALRELADKLLGRKA
ncbi:MAG: polyprenyl synthetase [Chloroflexi bacterium HGW-Chloroflexi-6]|nr:MAG: polyprenyl synthetase [Chloroflexi bacterium HGW-Chloroflexi-6]